MIPTNTQTTVVTTVSQVSLPSQTYAVDWDTGRIQGKLDGQSAMVQAVEKILRTQRFAYLIYSWNYGVDTIPNTTDTGVLEAVISQALCQDSRILSVSNLVATQSSRNSLHLSFDVETIFGTMNQEVDT